MSNDEILAEIAAHPELAYARKIKLQSEITRRYSFSMACFAFAFIAVPLGLGARRRDTSGGLILSLLIGTGYFMVTIFAEQCKSEVWVRYMLWAPNLACVLLGLFLFHRTRFK
jgi:lipopolysaccharide export system permease protein